VDIMNRGESMEFRPGVAKHVQIQEWMAANISDGTWTPGMVLPGVDMIAADLGCSMGTVRRAEVGMAAHGWLVIAGPGLRTRVVGPPLARPADLIGEIRELQGQLSRKTTELAVLLGVPA
jgi:DNA-binding GntR family transcriptional regulator